MQKLRNGSNRNHLGGGSNPNRTQILTGTVADIWTQLSESDLGDIFHALQRGDATVILEMDTAGLGYGIIYQYLYYAFETSGSNEGGIANYIRWMDGDGTLVKAYVFQQGETLDMSPFADYVAVTATILWHPMPGSPRLT